MQHYVPMRCKARLRLTLGSRPKDRSSVIKRIVRKLFGSKRQEG